MKGRLVQIAIRYETDVVLARQRVRGLTELLGFDKQDQTRIATALSEIARNAFEYANGGQIEFFIIGKTPPQLLEIVVSDKGPGIENVQAILEGSHKSSTGLGVGIIGAQRLMDQFSIESSVGHGTTVQLRKFLPSKVGAIMPDMFPGIVERLMISDRMDPLTEIRGQNQELLLSLDLLRRQHEELQRLNDELEDTNRGVVALYAELDERADHLRRADELKSRFLSNMSHEFRTPLNSIIALSRLLQDRIDGPLNIEQEKQIRLIRRSAENLTELVNDLLDLAKVEAGKIDIRPMEFSLPSLFGALRGMLKPLLVGEKVALVFDEVEELPTIYSDENKVSQILRNFISNAIKFTEHGTVRVSAALSKERNEVILSVTDSGIGIPEESIENIFQEFVQLDNPAQRRHKGTGLGLPLSKKLATLLNGRIEVVSAPGQGSTFSLHLPVAYDTPLPTDDSVVDSTEKPPGIQILAVEDDPADLYVYQQLFARTNYSLTSARTTAEARRLVNQSKPAAILLDLLLFNETSWKFLASLKQDAFTNDIPVIVVSTIEDEQKALALGAEAYLSKPINRIQLLSVLSRMLSSARVKVLVTEDDEAFRYIIRQSLPANQYEIIEAPTGIECLQLAREMCIDVLLLDINLPGMTGSIVVEKLASDERTRHIPVVIVTAEILDAHLNALADKVSEIVSKKDLSAQLLIATIAKAMRQRQKVGV